MEIFHLAPAVSVRVAGDTRIARSLFCNQCDRKMSEAWRWPWLLEDAQDPLARRVLLPGTGREERYNLGSFRVVRRGSEKMFIIWEAIG